MWRDSGQVEKTMHIGGCDRPDQQSDNTDPEHINAPGVDQPAMCTPSRLHASRLRPPQTVRPRTTPHAAHRRSLSLA